MKFTAVLFFATLIAGAAAQTTTTTSSAPVNTNSSYGPKVDECLKTCTSKEVSCQATCLGNPNPTPEQVNETTKCAMACPQGSGSKADTDAYAQCQRDCTVKYFLPNVSYVPSSGATQTAGTDTSAPTGSTDSTDTTGSKGSTSPTTTDKNGNKVNSTSTSTSTSHTATGGASSMVYSASFAGAIAAFAALFTL